MKLNSKYNNTIKKKEYFSNNRQDMLFYIPDWVNTTLEFGCGDGSFSELVKNKYGSESWAVEIESEYAKEASGKIDRVINNDAFKSLPELPDNYFDCIIMFDFLEHLQHPWMLLEKIKCKLSKNGIIVTSIPNIRYYRVFKDLLLYGEWNYQDQGVLDITHLRFFTYKTIINMFNDLDYEIITMKGIHPTRSKNLKIINFMTFNLFSDAKYLHYVNVVKPKK